MRDQLDQISDAEKAVFKSAIAGAIYLKLKSHPRRFSELEDTIGSSPNSLTKNLNKGREIGVWEKSDGRYRLTSRGANLPELISVHAKLQQEHEIVYNGTRYNHIDVPNGESRVINGIGIGGSGFRLTEQYHKTRDLENTEIESAEELLAWFNPEIFSNA